MNQKGLSATKRNSSDVIQSEEVTYEARQHLKEDKTRGKDVRINLKRYEEWRGRAGGWGLRRVKGQGCSGCC